MLRQSSRPSGWFDPTDLLTMEEVAREDGSYLCVSPLRSPLNSQLSKSSHNDDKQHAIS